MNSFHKMMKMKDNRFIHLYSINKIFKINYFNFTQAKVVKNAAKPINEIKDQKVNPKESKDVKNVKDVKDSSVVSKPINNVYIPKKDITPEIKKQIQDNFRKEFLNHYGGKNALKSKYYSDTFEHYSKKRRRIFLNSFYWPNQAHKIKVERMREYDECQYKLYEKKLVPIKIAAREEFPQLDFVVKRKYFTRWMT